MLFGPYLYRYSQVVSSKAQHDERSIQDKVILDIIMPGLSGGETFERLREIDPKIRILLSSCYNIDGQAQQILDQGCKGFLQKPFQCKALSYKVREVLGEPPA